jgi:hypothetical protein
MPTEYTIRTDVKFGPLEVIDVNAVREPWFNQTLTRVNDCVVRLGVVQGEFHWHKHDAEDEFFFVVDGALFVDVEGGPSVELRPGQGFTAAGRGAPDAGAGEDGDADVRGGGGEGDGGLAVSLPVARARGPVLWLLFLWARCLVARRR